MRRIGLICAMLGGAVLLGAWVVVAAEAPALVKVNGPGPVAYVRFLAGDVAAYGIIEGHHVRRLDGDLFGSWRKTNETYPLKEIKLLVPTRPTKVLAMAGNYESHQGTTPASPNPEVFFKVPSCLIAPDESIVIPRGTEVVHAEGEMVIVIGRRAKNVPEAEALPYVLGVTCGNDVSARDWQQNDRQWWRAKGTDTFGPCGPFIVSGINYDDLLLTCRVNGQVRQQQRTKDLVFNMAQIVSWASRHVTLEPGDLIYTGTPDKTAAIKPGDVVEVELEHVGVLKNPVAAEKSR